MKESREEIVRDILRRCGALREGSHFLLASGLHSTKYVEKVFATGDPDVRKEFAGMIADEIGDLGIQVVVGSPMGAISLATTLSDIMGVPLAFLEKQKDKLALRGANVKFVEGKRVWLVEDIITSGGTTDEATDVIVAAGGEFVGVSCIFDRSTCTIKPFKPKFGAFVALATAQLGEFPTYVPDECPQCKAGVPFDKMSGHGATKTTA